MGKATMPPPLLEQAVGIGSLSSKLRYAIIVLSVVFITKGKVYRMRADALLKVQATIAKQRTKAKEKAAYQRAVRAMVVE